MAEPAKLTSFHLFPLLPMELRLLIWTHTYPRPRHVIAGWKLSIPSALHACHESRIEALKIYPLLYTGGASAIYLVPKYTFTDFVSDTVVLDDRFIRYFQPQDLLRIRHLAIRIVHEDRLLESIFYYVSQVLCNSRTLLTLEVVRVGLEKWLDSYARMEWLQKVKGKFMECHNGEPGYVCPRLRMVDAGKTSCNVLAAFDWPEETTDTERYFTYRDV